MQFEFMHKSQSSQADDMFSSLVYEILNALPTFSCVLRTISRATRGSAAIAARLVTPAQASATRSARLRSQRLLVFITENNFRGGPLWPPR